MPKTDSEVIAAVYLVSDLSSKVGSLTQVKTGLKNTITAAAFTSRQLVPIASIHLIVLRMGPSARHPSRGLCLINCSITSGYCFRSIGSHASGAFLKLLCGPSC